MSTTTRSAERVEFLSDIIVAAVEGGTGYWAQVSQYQFTYDGELRSGVGPIVEGAGTSAVLHEEDEDQESGYKAEGMTLTIDAVARALGKIQAGGVKHLGESTRQAIMVADRENDAGDIDAGDADIIAQIALLNEITYG